MPSTLLFALAKKYIAAKCGNQNAFVGKILVLGQE